MSLPPPTTPAVELIACYRHPSRPAGRRCTRCGRPCCDDCLTRAAVGSNCPDCLRAARPAASTRVRHWQARHAALVTRSLIAVNLAVFAYITLAEPASLGGGISRGQFDLGLSARFLLESPVEWYRLLSSGFIHFGVIHVGFNMYLLFQLGNLLEPEVGRVRFGLAYLAALLGGSAGAMVLQPNGLHGGASGAVFGLMGLAFVGFKLRGINPMNTGIGSLLVLNLMITFVIPGISIGGHLGGVLVGAAAAPLLLSPRRVAPARAIAGLLILCAAAALIAVVSVGAL